MITRGRAVDFFAVLSWVFHAIFKCQALTCSGNVAYVKTEATFARDHVKYLAKTTLEQCQEYCTANKDDTGNPLPCRSIDYQVANQFCYLNHQAVDPFSAGSLERVTASVADNDHYEKVCVKTQVLPCQGDFAQFSRFQRYVLIGFADNVTKQRTMEDCLASCQNAFVSDTFPCMSAMYFYDTSDCVMNRETRFTQPNFFSEDEQDNAVDYFDNFCIGKYEAWSAWTECSAVCGAGWKQRRRRCPERYRCSGDEMEVMQCYKTCTSIAPRIASSDISWSPCSVTCGRGTQTRQKSCTNGDCRNSTEMEIRDCVERPCTFSRLADPVRSDREWSSWLPCSVTCGKGSQYRSRPCPSAAGPVCDRLEVDRKDCEVPIRCPRGDDVSDSITKWEQWSPCSTSCGKGLQARIQICNPAAACSTTRTIDTRPCQVSTRECDDTNNQRGDNWDPWEAWTDCSTSCSKGSRVRIRSCRTRYCNGNGNEFEECNSGPCDPQFGTWSKWSLCSSSCGDGARQRKRKCVAGNCNDGEYNEETVTCSTPCQATPGWGQWSEWTQCQVTCGSGLQERERVCNSPTNHCDFGFTAERRRCEPRKPPCVGEETTQGTTTDAVETTAQITSAPPPIVPATAPRETTDGSTDETNTLKELSDNEATEQFFQCCVQRGMKDTCARATCRYNATTDELIGSLYDPKTGCTFGGIPNFLECAADGNDNTACCQASGISEPLCLQGCSAHASGLSGSLESMEGMSCAFKIEKIIACHRKGVKRHASR